MIAPDSKHVSSRRLSLRITAALGLVFAFLSVVGGGCSTSNSLVGGQCISGYIVCGNECINPATDLSNCGRCGVKCAAGVACGSGVCGGPIDANGEADGNVSDASENPEDADISDALVDVNSSDANQSDANQSDANGPDSSSGDGSTPDAGADAEADAEVDASVDAEVDAADAAPDAPVPLSCTFPQLDCGGLACVNSLIDNDNCGGCGQFCPSQGCSAATCPGSLPVNVVLLGHDYSSSPLGTIPTSQERLLGNAIALLTPAVSIRMRYVTTDANGTAVTNVRTIADRVAALYGKTVQKFEMADATQMVNVTRLTAGALQTDVLLIHDQLPGTPGNFSALATGPLTSAFTTFLNEQGVIIVLDGNRAASATTDMTDFVVNSGLLTNLTAHATATSGNTLSVDFLNPDPVGAQVVSPYTGLANTTAFTLSVQQGIYVVKDNTGSGNPVVIHRTL